MKRGGYIKRRTPLAKRNPKRLARLQQEQYGGAYGEAIRQMGCCVCAAPPPSDRAHVRSRGAGGKAWKNLVALCRACHDEQGRMPLAEFNALYRVDLTAIARKIGEDLEAKGIKP